MSFLVKHKGIIIPLVAGLAIGQVVTNNKELFQGMEKTFLAGLLLTFSAGYAFIQLGFTSDSLTNIGANFKRVGYILLILIGLVGTLGPIFIHGCDRDLAGVQCDCNGVKFDLYGTFLSSRGDSEPSNYCLGVVEGNYEHKK